MKTQSLILSVVASIMSFSTAYAGRADVRESGGMHAPTGVKVEFISIGAGIDSEAYKKAKALISKQKMDRSLIEVRSSNWGMEGEETLCLQYDIKGRVMIAIDSAREISEFITKKDLTKVTVVQSCDADKVPGPSL